MTKSTNPDVLLPSHIYPTHYNIFLTPDLTNFVFEGEEEIEITLTKQASEIVLHSAEIEVFSASIMVGKEISARKISYNEKAETVTLYFSDPIPKGNAVIKLKFAGILNDKMRGFYRSKYIHEGQEYHMGVTQFESTDARRAFPCFDEPSHKATFNVKLKVPSDRTVISNTLEESVVEHEGGYKIVQFEKSPKMSSYLLAFIVGHFESVKAVTGRGVKVRVFVTPGKKKQAQFALDVTCKIMDFYHDYFGIAYPLPTMDLIAIPDFANGAMENWGAVTYRETALLVDAEHSSLHTKQWVALIIAHELAHQWFGNLVTMKWWTHLWLNEGFASFMEYVAVDKLFPEWNIWTQFVYTEQAKALALDGLSNTHAIEIPVHHPGEISEIFDAVSYSKGASIIRMLQDYLGEKTFQKGLQIYLKTHMYANATTEDLWDALEKASNKPVGKIMEKWTSMPGYPLIHASIVKGSLQLSQEKFYANPVKDRTNPTWLVPTSIVSSDRKRAVTLLIEKKKMTLPGFGQKSWIKVNAHDTSFIRVNYSRQLLKEFENPIRRQDERLTEEGKFALVRDAFALVEAGYADAESAFSLLDSFKDETSYIVWAEIVVHLLHYKSLLSDKSCEGQYDTFARSLLAKISSEVGFKKKKGEEHARTLLRSTILYALGTFKDRSTIEHSRMLFEKRAEQKIDSDLRGMVYALVAENGSKKDYSMLEQIYLEAGSEEEKDRALRALCSFTDRSLLTKTLTLAFSKAVRSQDSFKAVYLMAQNPHGIEIVWSYVKENWDEISTRFEGGHLFSRFISPFSKFTAKDKAEEVKKFFKKQKAEGIERTVAQTVEKINSNASLLKREEKKIELFLKNC